MAEQDINASRIYQRQTISNLYNSGIPKEIIALQLDIEEKDVEEIIKQIRKEQKQGLSNIQTSLELDSSSMDLFYLDAVVNIDLAIKHAQVSIWSWQ
jgi:hypothetical protein